MDATRSVEALREPAFAVDVRGVIVAWNRASELWSGHAACCARGARCYELLRGRDAFGNRYCSPHCPLMWMALHGEAVGPTRMTFRHASGHGLSAGVTLLVLPGERVGAPALVHRVHASVAVPASVSRSDPDLAGAMWRVGRGPACQLTKRQAEVLALLARGLDTRAIAQQLSLSVTTVRNHVQGILRTLRSHNRLEAVYIARRAGLV